MAALSICTGFIVRTKHKAAHVCREGVKGLRGYLGDIINTIVVVGVRGKNNFKCWKVDGTHAPERGAVVDRRLAR